MSFTRDFAEAVKILRWYESRPDHPKAYAEMLVGRYWQLVDRMIMEANADG